MRALVFTGAGGSEVMRLEERPTPVPGEDSLVVAVRFAALNAADLAQRAGTYPAPPGAPSDIPGLEVAGVVAAVGARVTEFAQGDRVFGLVGGGGLADSVVVHERHLTRVPHTLSDEEAAAVPEAFITAHDAIVTQGRLASGELLLVNGANGGVGSAAVQIGLAAGARVIASARTSLNQLSELGAQALEPIEAFARAQAEGGADLILELVGAPNLPPDLEALAVRGRVAVVGTGAGADATVSLRTLMGRRGRIFGTQLRARPLEQKAAAVQAFAREVVPHLSAGRIRAVIDNIFAVEEAAAAFEAMASRGKFGKILLAF